MHHLGEARKEPRGRDYEWEGFTRRPVEETNSWVTRFVQRVKHSMTFFGWWSWCSTGYRRRLKNKMHGKMIQVWGNWHSITHSCLLQLQPVIWKIGSNSSYGHLNPTYVIETSFSFTLIIIDMKRTNKKNKAYKSKERIYDRRSMHEPQAGPSTLTSTSTSATDLMPYIPPACDLDATSSSSARVTAGGSVSYPSHL